MDTLTFAMLSVTLNVRGEEVSEAGLAPRGSSDLIPFFLVHSRGSVTLTKKAMNLDTVRSDSGVPPVCKGTGFQSDCAFAMRADRSYEGGGTF